MPKYYSVQNKTKTSVDILIYGVIGDSWYQESVTARQFVADFKELEKEYDTINVHINSPGGSVWDGLPIFNIINASAKEVHTFNDGLCASMGSCILCAVPVNNRHASKPALTMVHAPITGVYGNAGDIQQVLEMLDKVKSSVISCIANDSDQTPEQIQAKYFDDYKDHWFTSEEAKTEGLIGDVTPGKSNVSNKVIGMPINDIMDQFDSLVKGPSKLEKFFSNALNFFTPNSEIDMDIKVLAKACGLSDKATEQEVLDWIEEHGKPVDETEETEETEEEEEIEEEETTEETEELDPKDQEIAALKAQLAAKGAAPGAKNKKVVKVTDSKSTKSGGNFDTYKDAKATWDAVDDLFK